jgi:hypothetical protein
VILDGVAAKQLADEWAEAPAENSVTALALVISNETVNHALASLFNLAFAGVAFILFGLAVASSERFPRWLGWVAVVAGVASISAGLVQGILGEPSMASRILTVIGPTIITLWMLTIGLLMAQMAGRLLSDSARR